MQESEIVWANSTLENIRNEIAKVLIGQKKLVERLLIGALTEGHILLEGVPGIAKTLAVNSFAKVLNLQCKRIQFTPDLLPSDLIGTSVYNPKEASFFVEKGPLFTNIVIADEINRAPPKVQSALLEVMQEKQITISGTSFKAPLPFMVLATQNPIEHEGTYPLPEAALDRFMMKVNVTYPTKEEEFSIVGQQLKILKNEPANIGTAEDIEQLRKVVDAIFLDDKILHYILDVVNATREPAKYACPIEGFLEYGASPRASIYIAHAAKAHALLSGRSYTTPFDVKEVAPDVLRHRIILSYEALSAEQTAETIISTILSKIQVP